MKKLIANLLPHQVQTVEFVKYRHYSLIGHHMGLGKTLCSIASYINEGNFCLIVCPAFLKYNWESEFKKFTSSCKVKVINTQKDLVEAMTANVAIINYERLSLAEELFKRADFVIADEAHMLKNLEAKRTQLFHNYVKAFRPERLQLLSGTAIKNRVEEFYSLLVLLSYTKHKTNGKDVNVSYRNQYQFSRHFSNEIVFKIFRGGREVTIRKFEGLRNEEELRSLLKDKYIRFKDDILKDLPELQSKVVYVKYDYNDKDLQAALENELSNTDGHISKVKAGSALAKAPFTIDYAKSLHEETGSPIVIFCDHVESVQTIAAGLKNSAVITGATSMEKRNDIVNQFQAGKLTYLVATIGAASVGLTLTQANHLIFNSLSWVPANNAQAKKRIHRIGQKNICFVHLIAGSEVDKMIITSLQSKSAVIERIL
jgi:SNF2 family DNA or RNA helicase